VSTTFTEAAVAFAGVMTVIEVALTFVISVPVVPPKVTAVVPVKLVPVIVTAVPPASPPEFGDKVEIVGVSTNVKAESEETEPPTPVNVTAIVPAACAGVTTVIEVSLVFVIDVPAVPPNVTADVPVKFVPVIVTVVPPAIGPAANPVAASTDEIVGVPINLNPPELVAVPPAVVNATSLAPAVPDGVVTVTEVALTLVSEVPALPSKVTLVVADKLVPVIVTVVDPAVGPLDGDTELIVGA